MAIHTSETGIEEDDGGFYVVTCTCGAHIGPAPDHETLRRLIEYVEKSQ